MKSYQHLLQRYFDQYGFVLDKKSLQEVLQHTVFPLFVKKFVDIFQNVN